MARFLCQTARKLAFDRRISQTLAFRMKTRPLIWLCAAPLVASLSSGCIFLKELPRETPPPTPTPPPEKVFDPADGQSRGLKLNDSSQPAFDPSAVALPPTPVPGQPFPTPTPPPPPHAFRIARVVSGDTVILQSLRKVKGEGEAIVNALGAPENSTPSRLAGIIAPKPPSPGAQNSINTLFQWAAGQDLDVDLDPKYPSNTDGQKLVHIFFKGRPNRDGSEGPYTGKTLSLNRMMVRSGYAIVDLYSPTSFDRQVWLLDEAYARENRLGLWKTNIFPLLQQRLPSKGTAGRATVNVQTGVQSSTTTTQSTATQSAPTPPTGAPTADAPTTPSAP